MDFSLRFTDRTRGFSSPFTDFIDRTRGLILISQIGHSILVLILQISQIGQGGLVLVSQILQIGKRF